MSVARTRLARAKINLSLRVVGRRPVGAEKAGYHELDSLVVFADAGDRVTVAPAEDLSLTLTGPFAAGLRGEADNLVLRAARTLAQALGRRPNVAISLNKHLPVSSGIGGGSADAAATFTALADLWDVAEGAVDLAALGLALGADLPVCLAGRPCRVRGIGEVLEPVASLPPAWLLLANPGRAMPTPPVFAARRGAFSAPLDFPADGFATAADLASFIGTAGNDLTEAASGLCTEIPELLEALASLDGVLTAGLSGSGATCFALFAEGEAMRAAEKKARRDALAPWVLGTAMAGGQG